MKDGRMDEKGREKLRKEGWEKLDSLDLSFWTAGDSDIVEVWRSRDDEASVIIYKDDTYVVAVR